ncbi:MAG: hypothetical protein SYR96_14880 [Actinomycetota bacterium]|nr:hypothetical protein [Actinomycetota bacterium]
MSAPLSRLLEHVLEGEPPIGDEVDAVFRQADRLRRRRTRAVLALGAATAGLIAVLGYVLTSTLLAPPPAPIEQPSQAPVLTAEPSPAPADRVRDVIEPLVEGRELRVRPGQPERGDGWRRYEITDSDGRSRGVVQVAAFDVRKKWCFPVAADPGECARPDRAGGLEFVRYDDVDDPDRQVRQTIARRLDDGRTVAVMAAGKQDAGAERGRPALTGAQVEQVATDERVFEAFGPGEDCDKGCPDFETPVEKQD